MNVEQVRKIISEMGWSPVEKTRRNGTPYLYAARRSKIVKDKIEWRYIAPTGQLSTMTETQIVAILNRVEAR